MASSLRVASSILARLPGSARLQAVHPLSRPAGHRALLPLTAGSLRSSASGAVGDVPVDASALRKGELPLWMLYGVSFNSVMLISGDLMDFMFASQLGLSPLAAAGIANAALGAAGICSLQVLPGVLNMPNKAREPEAFNAKLQGRILGIWLGFLIGLWPLMWPEEWRLWKAGAAATKAAIQPPPTKEELEVRKICQDKFPAGMTGPDVEQVLYSELRSRGWTVQNTLLAHATCPDEVNYDSDADLVNVLAKRWGKRFTLGGLAGMAFAGKTGWAAFSAHTPEKGGRILVLYGPHVGVGNDGTVGKVRREGQSHDSTCCGAAVAAFNAATVPSGDDWIVDMQQIALTKLLRPLKPVIEADPEPMKALAYANFEISHQLLSKQLASPEKVCAEIAVVGGIMVNLPGNLDDQFIPLTFEVLDCTTGEITDCFHRFGRTRPEHAFGSSAPRGAFFEEQAGEIRKALAARR